MCRVAGVDLLTLNEMAHGRHGTRKACLYGSTIALALNLIVFAFPERRAYTRVTTQLQSFVNRMEDEGNSSPL